MATRAAIAKRKSVFMVIEDQLSECCVAGLEELINFEVLRIVVGGGGLQLYFIGRVPGG